MRESDPTPNELQKALLGYEPSDLETALIDWSRENWPSAARGMVYARKEAADSQVRDHDLKVVLEVAARVSISERELLIRGLAEILPGWLERRYGLTPAE